MDDRRRVIPLQAVALLVVVGVIWLLHACGHGGLVALVVGIGTYAAINLIIWRIARGRASKREERQRRNLEADIDQQRAQLYGDDP